MAYGEKGNLDWTLHKTLIAEQLASWISGSKYVLLNMDIHSLTYWFTCRECRSWDIHNGSQSLLSGYSMMPDGLWNPWTFEIQAMYHDWRHKNRWTSNLLTPEKQTFWSISSPSCCVSFLDRNGPFLACLKKCDVLPNKHLTHTWQKTVLHSFALSQGIPVSRLRLTFQLDGPRTALPVRHSTPFIVLSVACLLKWKLCPLNKKQLYYPHWLRGSFSGVQVKSILSMWIAWAHAGKQPSISIRRAWHVRKGLYDWP